MSAYRDGRKDRGERSVIGATTTFDFTETLGEKLRRFSAKYIARSAGTNVRTAENLREGRNGPSWPTTARMLQDDELCKALLEAAGRGDLARSAETIAALKAALVSEGK